MARLNRFRRVLPGPIYYWIDARLGARLGDELHWSEYDDEENDRGIPPTDERIRWHGVWIVEAYLPSTIGSLVEGIQRLQWWDAHRPEDILRSVRSGRAGPGGGWVNLPLLRRRTQRPVFLMPSLDRELPAGVDYISGSIHFVTPSLTVLVAGFRFDDGLSGSLDQALRRRYKTYHPMTGWYSSQLMSPMFQRRDAVRALEKEMIDRCRQWLSDYLPGYFAGGIDRENWPATMLLTTQLVVPFERGEDRGFWAHEAGIDFAYERWETGITGLRYAMRPREDGVAVLAGRQSDIFSDPEEWRRYGHQSTVWSLMYLIEMRLSGLFAFLAADAILWDVRRRLGRLRDSVALVAASPTKDQLKSVKSQLGTMSSDLTSLTSEMLTWSEHRAWALHDVADVERINDFPRQGDAAETDEEPLRSKLLDRFIAHAREVRDFEAATRGLLVATAEIAGALENINLQSLVRWVSVLALIVAFLALVVSGVGVANDLVNAAQSPSAAPLP